MQQVCQDQGDMVEFSGPLLSQSYKVDELLERHERQIRQAVRRSWFQRGNLTFSLEFHHLTNHLIAHSESNRNTSRLLATKFGNGLETI